MKIIYSKIVPFKGFKAITIFPFIFVREEKKDEFTEVDLSHELIHIMQQVEMLAAGTLLTLALFALGCNLWSLLALPIYFYWYSIEYCVRMLGYGFNKKEAYRNIAFEQEAYNNEEVDEYLDTRKPFSWVKYLPLKTFTYDRFWYKKK